MTADPPLTGEVLPSIPLKDMTPEQRKIAKKLRRQQTAIAENRHLGEGNGVRKPLNELTLEERQQYRDKALETRRRNAALKKLQAEEASIIEMDAYLEAHRENAPAIFGMKLALMDGLMSETIDPETGAVDTTRLDDKRLKLLQSMLSEWEKAGGLAAPKAKAESSELTVNVVHEISKLTERLGRA